MAVGIAVLPTCSIRAEGSPKALAIRPLSARKSSPQAGSWGKRRNSCFLIPYIHGTFSVTPHARINRRAINLKDKRVADCESG